MARHRRSSPIENLFTLARLLPWWLSAFLAVAAYFFFSYYASQPVLVAQGVSPQEMAKSMTDLAIATVWRTLASVLRFIVPLVLGAGAVFSFIASRKPRLLHKQVACNPAPSALESMSWVDFEQLVAETFKRKGYQVKLRGRAGPDGGVDIELCQGNDKYLVQCKQWKTVQVGVGVVRELYGVMAAEGAVGGFVVASGSFTRDAKAFAEGRSIELVDARKLRRLIGGHQATKPEPVVPTVTTPACPLCGSHMVERVVRGGPKAGNKFWGCSQYPRCRGTRIK
jgi:restriction system protein